MLARPARCIVTPPGADSLPSFVPRLHIHVIASLTGARSVCTIPRVEMTVSMESLRHLAAMQLRFWAGRRQATETSSAGGAALILQRFSSGRIDFCRSV
jgi:hypothetical protein